MGFYSLPIPYHNFLRPNHTLMRLLYAFFGLDRFIPLDYDDGYNKFVLKGIDSMFKFVLDIRSMDYNAIYDQAMAMLKENPEMAAQAGGKIPGKIGGKIGGFLFHKIPDEQKSAAIAQLVTQKEAEFLPPLEESISRVCPVRLSHIEAVNGISKDTTLRFLLTVESIDLERASDFLTGYLLRDSDLPVVFGDRYHTGITTANARSQILSLPTQEAELCLMRLVKNHRFEILRAIETGARMKKIDVSFSDIKFLIPR